MLTGPATTVKRARALRSEMSLPEVLLWKALRQRPSGFKFRRQHAAGVYIADFYCASARLVIEVDGWAHEQEPTVRRDAAKAHFLHSQGVGTLRVPAKLVLADMPRVVTRIVTVCAERVGAD